MTYEQALKDWEYLWNIDCANDMTGGYVDQEDLDKLLKNPTKATAKGCLCHQIAYWFQAGTESHGSAKSIRECDSRVREIAARHRITYFG